MRKREILDLMTFDLLCRKIISNFNFLSKWITSTLDMEKDSSAQMETLKIFIDLLRELIKMRNLHSATSVLSGIKSSSVLNEKTQSDLRKGFLQLETKLERKTQKILGYNSKKTKKYLSYIGKYLQQIQEINNSYENNEVLLSLFYKERNVSQSFSILYLGTKWVCEFQEVSHCWIAHQRDPKRSTTMS